MVPKRLSGLQKDILSLYRKFLREATIKDRMAIGENRSFPSLLQSHGKSTVAYARAEFRKQTKEAKRSDFKKIEYMIRKGEKQLKVLKMPGTKVVAGAS